MWRECASLLESIRIRGHRRHAIRRRLLGGSCVGDAALYPSGEMVVESLAMNPLVITNDRILRAWKRCASDTARTCAEALFWALPLSQPRPELN